MVMGSVAIEDREDLDVVVDALDVMGGSIDLCTSEVILKVSLGGDVGWFDGVEVDELDLLRTDRSKLDGDLAADGADTDDCDFQVFEFFDWDEVLLTSEAVGG